jgi:hypothetical protein
MIDQQARTLPLGDIDETLREHVRGHVVGLFVEQVHVRGTEPFMQPRDRHPMRPSQMTHDGVPSCGADLYHGLVVLVKLENGLSAQQPIPQLHARHPFCA